MAKVRVKKIRDVVRMHQHWRHRKTRQAIYISQVYRHERRVLAIFFETGGLPGFESRRDYVSFAELQKNWTLMGPYPNAT